MKLLCYRQYDKMGSKFLNEDEVAIEVRHITPEYEWQEELVAIELDCDDENAAQIIFVPAIALRGLLNA